MTNVAGTAVARPNLQVTNNIVYFHFNDSNKDLVSSKLRSRNGIHLMLDGSVVTKLSRDSNNHVSLEIFSNIYGYQVILVTSDFNIAGLPIINRVDPGHFIQRIAFRRLRNRGPTVFLYAFRIDFVSSTGIRPLEQEFWLDENELRVTETGSFVVNLQSTAGV